MCVVVGGTVRQAPRLFLGKLRVSAKQKRMQITFCDLEAGVMEQAFPELGNSGGGWSSWVV